MTTTATQTDLTVANTILQQIGGGRALFMMGATNILGGPDSVQFRIKGCPSINSIRIVLDPSDTYTVEFWKIGRAPKFAMAKVSTYSDIYCDGLRDLIERETGLYLSLGTMGR